MPRDRARRRELAALGEQPADVPERVSVAVALGRHGGAGGGKQLGVLSLDDREWAAHDRTAHPRLALMA